MPRAPTNSDVFNAIADASRREILVFLAPTERAVGDVVLALRLRQSSVSKHLKVLHGAGLVRARRDGRSILYRTQAEAIQPVYEWTKTFEAYWRNQLMLVKRRAEKKQSEERTS